MSFKQFIIQQLKQQGDMPFVEFMQQALYAPQAGYYHAHRPKLGPGGDFITAPELTPLFGQSIAHQCLEVFDVCQSPVIFEFGAGSGKLAIDILQALEKFNQLPKAYHILEVSPHMRLLQQQAIDAQIPHLASNIIWHDRWPEIAIEGVMLANEVLDAMPVHRFCLSKQGLLESHIQLNEKAELEEIFKSCTDKRLMEYVAHAIPQSMYPYTSEANLWVEGWLQQCSKLLQKGAFFIIDYGFPRHEYYHPDRSMGTIMCHYQHQSHTNPLAHPGEEDITAHVDFTQVAEAGVAAGFHVAGYTNQASFLLGNHMLEYLGAITDERARIQAQQAVKYLLQASEMGELFKVIALTHQIDRGLSGFNLFDKRASL